MNSPPPQTPTYPIAESDSDSDSSQATTFAVPTRSPLPQRGGRSPAANDTFSRPPAAPRSSADRSRTDSPTAEYASQSHLGHRPRQRSQGYFEPSLPSNAGSMSSNNLTASQIAAQAAMHGQNTQHTRKRSTTIPEPGANAAPTGKRQPGSPPQNLPATVTFKTNGMTYQNGLMGGNRMAATTAANVAFPRSPLHSPGLSGPQPEHGSPKPPPPLMPDPPPLKPIKEKSKMKLFSKPKSIGITKDKDWDKKHPPLPSPGKIGMHSSHALNRVMMNQSTTSLADSNASSASSLYSSANASTSTLVPTRSEIPMPPPPLERDKEKHKHHFLSRNKHKVKDDQYHLPLSSASSNSKPTDPNAQPLYNFAAPSSPGHASTFTSSVTGLDLRHGGRGLREKKKADKAAAQYADPLDPPFRERNQSFSTDRTEWPGTGSLGATPGLMLAGGLGPSGSTPISYHDSTMTSLGASFGLHGIGPDDAWPLLKARLLHIFEGEDPRPPIEDFNALVSVHIKRCVQKRSPTLVIEDLTELLTTGFLSLDQTLRHVPDERLILHLTELWLVVFTTILPFLQAVFLPLDLEFKGRGIMSAAAAAEFWGASLPDHDTTSNRNIPTLGEDLDVRRIILITFRDTVILPRHETLMTIFSRLSLENLASGLESPNPIPDIGAAGRPGTAASGSDSAAAMSSLNSQGSTLLDSTSSTSFPTSTSSLSRSRATSNTSAGSFSATSLNNINTTGSPAPVVPASNPSSLPPQLQTPRHMDSAQVTETVGRMLQCVSVLASTQSGDEAQGKMERLIKELKYNWLGRGRTGRQRRGFVGPRRGGVGLNLGLGVPGMTGVGAG